MSPEQAIGLVRGYARAGRIIVSSHASQRMRQRNVTFKDLSHALSSARTCDAEGDARWKVTGPDIDGEDLSAIVVLDDGDVVVTVF